MQEGHFIYIADVFCPWCFAFGPVMRQISEQYPEFPVRVVGGNLISKPMTLAQDAAQNPGLIDFWREVEKISGRSLQGAITAIEEKRDIILYSPGADEILVELKRFVPDHELAQLLFLEDLFYGKGLNIFDEKGLNEIAEHWQIDPGRFEAALDNHQALLATERNIREQAKLMGEITSYPSVLLAREDKIMAVSRGYVHYETIYARLQHAIEDLELAPLESSSCSVQDSCTLHRHG